MLQVCSSMYIRMYIFCTEWPLAVLDAGKEMNSDTLKKRIAETALTIKTIYWYVCKCVDYTGTLLCPHGLLALVLSCVLMAHWHWYSPVSSWPVVIGNLLCPHGLLALAISCVLMACWHWYFPVSSWPVLCLYSVSCPTMMSSSLLCSSMTWRTYRTTLSSHQVLTPRMYVCMYACTCACGIVVHMHSTSERKNLVYSIIQYVYTILMRVRHSHQTWQMCIFCTEGWAQIVGQILSSGCAVIVTAT